MIKVHSYESMGTFDGPGLRLVVFLQGCNFRCLYCANPDTIDLRGESKETSIEEILRMAMNQRPFFGKKGGITFSGGEPTIQAKELLPLFRRLKELNIHICLDTNGSIWNEYIAELLSLTDLVLLDVKQINDTRHRELTERSNQQTLKTAEWLENNNIPFWLRYVLVPQYSNLEDDICTLGEHFKDYRMEAGGLHGFVDLLAGDVNYPAVMEALKAIGYDGWVSAEMIPNYKYYTETIIYNTSKAMDAILGK